MKCFLVLAVSLLFVSCNYKNETTDHLKLKNKLEGKWQAKAFDGVLAEQWLLSNNGWMEQQGYYIEEKDTNYSAKTRIEKVGDDVILFSVIKNGTPKIFKSISLTENQIVFENKDYRNPYRVTYKFLDKMNYRRTITGYEGDSLVDYVFDFKKSNN